MNDTGSIVITLPLNRVALAHLLRAGIVRAEDLLDSLSPLLLAHTADAIVELHQHTEQSAQAYFINTLRELAAVSISAPAPAASVDLSHSSGRRRRSPSGRTGDRP